MSTKNQTVKVEIDIDLMKYVIGYNLSNLKELREKFPMLRINNGKRIIYIEGENIGMIDKCKCELDNIIVRAMATKNASQYKKRIEKEIETKRRVVAAANRIRDNIESEIKMRHKEDIASKIGISPVEQQLQIGSNAKPNKLMGMFAGLEVEDNN